MRFGLFLQPMHHPREHPTLAIERDLDFLSHLDSLGYSEERLPWADRSASTARDDFDLSVINHTDAVGGGGFLAPLWILIEL